MNDTVFEGSVWPALLALAAAKSAPPQHHPFWDLYAPVAAGKNEGAFVIGQIGQSLDGRVATATGKSRTISGAEAIFHLHRLRALVDAVIVGVGTVIADDPALSVRDVAGPSPKRVIIDPNFRLPASSRLLRDDGAAVFAIQTETRARPAGVTPIIVSATGGGLAPGDIIAALVERGMRRILVEGGPTTLSAFLSAGALDRLHASVAPIILGSGPSGINLPPIDAVDEALRPQAAMHRLGTDVLFDCNLSPRARR